MDDLQQTLDKFKVPSAEQAEPKATVQSTFGDIVVDQGLRRLTAVLQRTFGQGQRW
jgi:hypothetical protein